MWIRVVWILSMLQFLISCKNVNAPSYTLEGNNFQITFHNQWRLQDLSAVQQELTAMDISLNFDALEFNDHGNLKKIKASVTWPDGKKGSFQSGELNPPNLPGPGFKKQLSKTNN